MRGPNLIFIVWLQTIYMGPFESFRSRHGSEAHAHIDEARQFCLALDSSVVESVRAHRIVYGRGMSMRWFVDICPGEDSTTVKIQRGRKQEPLIRIVPYKDSIATVFASIRTAYDTLH